MPRPVSACLKRPFVRRLCLHMAEARKSDQFIPLYRLPPGDRSVAAIPGHDCVVALRALGEDTRVRIVGLLIHEALDVGEIAKRLGVSQYNVSKHLRILREAGLLEVEKSGRTRMYGLSEMIRGRATAGGVLDLGCCSFQFDDEGSVAGARANKSAATARTVRKRPRRSRPRIA
jgi:DNA-binding transcriptional ArsR family regulator